MRRLVAAIVATGLAFGVVARGGAAAEPARITGELVGGGVRFARQSEDKFGGAWIDGDRGVLVIAVTSSAGPAYVESVRQMLPEWVTVEVVRVEHSERELLTIYKAASQAMTAEQEPGGIVSVRVRERQNLVEIGIAPADYDQMAEGIRARFGGVELVLRAVGPDSPTSCTRTSCNSSPWKAGIRIDMPDQGDPDGPCTSGFIAYRPNHQNGPAYRMITAGHCGYDGQGSQVGDTWYHDTAHTIVIGDVTHTRYTGETAADALLIDIASGREGHKYLKGDDNVVSVAGIENRDDTLNGDDVCLSAYTAYLDSTSRRCGEVTDRWYSTSYHSGVTLINQMLADYSTDFGDSGGPVMARWSENAIGIQSGKTTGGEAIFTHVSGFQTEYPEYTLCTSTDSHTGC
jgi:hypothetical protein